MSPRIRLLAGIAIGSLLLPFSMSAVSPCAEQARSAYQQRIDAAAGVRDSVIDAAEQQRDEALAAADRLTDKQAKEARRRAKDAFQTAQRAARDAYKQEYREAKDEYRDAKEVCREADKRSRHPSTTGGSGSGANCEPYICSNGKRYPTCNAQGYPINYFVNPCKVF